jgi:hypothetical protein
MNRTVFYATLAAALISGTGGSAYSKATTAAASEHTSAAAHANVPARSRDIDQARVHLNHAQAELGRKEDTRAAASLRAAAADIDRQVARARGVSNVDLVRDAAALRTAATEVEAGRISDVSGFKRQLIGVRIDLARHHYAAAADAWAKKEYTAAGESLAAAARYIESGFASLGQKSGAELKAAEASAAQLGRKGARAAQSEYERAHDAIGRALERLHTPTAPQKTSSPAQSPFDVGA